MIDHRILRKTKYSINLATPFRQLIIWIMLFGGLLFVVIKPMGLDFSLLPGNLADPRFNNYILEHGFRYITGVDKSFWNAQIFYPYPQAITFSDNLLGSLPFYSPFRFIGLDRETAYQGWYILGFILNYLSAVYILSKFEFKPLAIATGAFFFTFGLPMMNQTCHTQLLYRFCVPFASYSLYQFFNKQKLSSLVAANFWLVWQFYLSIYMGFFLILFLIVMSVLLPTFTIHSLKQKILSWPKIITQSWKCSLLRERIFAITSWIIFCVAMFVLLKPYYNTSVVYGFSRSWEETKTMLPRWQSYFLADQLPIWEKVSQNISPDLPMRHEHQLFPGIAVIGLILLGMILRPKSDKRQVAWLYLTLGMALALLTLYFHRFTLYRLVWWLPGFNSIRAVSRIMLVIMWPIAIFVAYVINELIQDSRRSSVIPCGIACFFILILFIEPILIQQPVFAKADAQKRITDYLAKIPKNLPKNSILYFPAIDDEKWYATEIDAMLVSQDLGLPTVNGYSGNLPRGFHVARDGCLVPIHFQNYISFTNLTDEKFVEQMMDRVVFVGSTKCSLIP